MEEQPTNCNGNGVVGQENGDHPVGAVDPPASEPVNGANGNENSPGTPPPPNLNGNGMEDVAPAPSPEQRGARCCNEEVDQAEGEQRNEANEAGQFVDEPLVFEPHQYPALEPMDNTDPIYYDIFPANIHYIYHVEAGRNLTTQLSRAQVEFQVRAVVENNVERIKNSLGIELKDVFPPLFSLVTTLKVYREKNRLSRLADFLANGSSPDLPSGSSSSSHNSSRQRLNSDSKSRPTLSSNSPPKKGPLKATKNERSNGTNSAPITNGVVENEANRCFRYHIFDLYREDGEADLLMQDQMEYEDEHVDPTVHSNHFIVPRDEWMGLWDSLFFEDDVKQRLFQYISSALLFSAKTVNPTYVSFNKVLMLHGPPGCGKTSLCKALAQKCAVRFAHRYEGVQLLEINAHSLFSKWFSESGKLVDKMFNKIFEMVHEQKSLVMLLIDEVESLAQCRQAAIHGFEPTDSIRAVNALLTNIDSLSQYPNVVVMTTSNIVGGIDLAFLDRADLRVYLGPPPTEVVYSVLSSSLNELLNSEIVAPFRAEFRFPTNMHDEQAKNTNSPDSSRILKLIKMAKMASGFSGRALRKICFLAHARFFNSVGIELDTFLDALRVTIQAEMDENDRLNKQRNISTAAPRLLATPQRNQH